MQGKKKKRRGRGTPNPWKVGDYALIKEYVAGLVPPLHLVIRITAVPSLKYEGHYLAEGDVVACSRDNDYVLHGFVFDASDRPYKVTGTQLVLARLGAWDTIVLDTPPHDLYK